VRDVIKHTPFDLGLGVQFGYNKEADVRGICFAQVCEQRAVLIWQTVNCIKPLLVIQFEEVLVLRQLDEFWLSLETNSDRWLGIEGSFARLVEGGEYPTQRSLMVDTGCPSTYHFQFVTGHDCVDVISYDKPKSCFAEWSEQAQFAMRLAPD
jgi:hypothetical protein